MTFLQRIRNLWLGFWGLLIGARENANPALVAQGQLEQYRRQFAQVRQAIADLIYQRKTLEEREKWTRGEAVQLEMDLKDALADDSDTIAAQLMEKIDEAKHEAEFVSKQLDQVRRDIIAARDLEMQLGKAIEQGSRSIDALKSRAQFMRIRREIQGQMQRIHGTLQYGQALLDSPVANEIRRLEAQMEAESFHRTEEADVHNLRESRRQRELLERVKELKDNSKSAHVAQAAPN